MNDTQRAALISLINSIFPVLNLSGILSLSGDEVAVVMLLVSQALTTFMLFYKKPDIPPLPNP